MSEWTSLENWLSCPECGSGDIYLQTIAPSERPKPEGVVKEFRVLRFHCNACELLSQEFPVEKYSV